jgi:hypothetical protein
MAGPTVFSINTCCNNGYCRYLYDHEIKLFDLAPDVQNIIAIIGAVTSLVPLSHWFKLILKSLPTLPFLNWG